jgi:hypothetical protein
MTWNRSTLCIEINLLKTYPYANYEDAQKVKGDHDKVPSFQLRLFIVKLLAVSHFKTFWQLNSFSLPWKPLNGITVNVISRLL